VQCFHFNQYITIKTWPIDKEPPHRAPAAFDCYQLVILAKQAWITAAHALALKASTPNPRGYGNNDGVSPVRYEQEYKEKLLSV
jgi:hypothetical protein